MTYHAHNTQGHFTSGAGPSNHPGALPSISSAALEDGEDQPLHASGSQPNDDAVINIPHCACATSESNPVTSTPIQHQVPPHFHTPSMFTTPTTSVPILNPLPPTCIPSLIPLAPAPTLVIPLAPAGIDPAVWANNQALILSLLHAFQALYHPPAQPLPPKEGDVKALTSFSSKDHTKLRDFLFECGLIFDTKPRTFATEKSRVLYTIQHLNGMAKRHFRHYIKAGGTDPKVNQWNIFTTELETVFSDPDWLGRASEKLLGLKMKETSRVH